MVGNISNEPVLNYKPRPNNHIIWYGCQYGEDQGWLISQGLLRWHDFLWDIMYHVFGGAIVFVHDTLFSNISNRCYALFLLKNSLLGLHYVNHMAAQLEINIPSFSYDGEKRGFTFQNFVNLHKGQHIISYGLAEYVYSEFDDNSKLCMLIYGINTNALDSGKSVILDSP